MQLFRQQFKRSNDCLINELWQIIGLSIAWQSSLFRSALFWRVGCFEQRPSITPPIL